MRHANVVLFYGIYTSPKKERYIVTEFCSKGSLKDLLVNEGSNLELSDLLGMYVKNL